MIDLDFDFRKDCKEGADPDKYSIKLKETHCELWSKELPNTKNGKLNLKVKNSRIVGEAGNSQFDFGSDSITNCYGKRPTTEEFRKNIEISKSLDDYDAVNYVLSASIIFPLKDDNGKISWTINRARGCSRRICDRIDLTLECIRIFYLDKSEYTPLRSCLIRYSSFFDLFIDFENYVKFFYLDDLVSSDYKKVKPLTSSLDFMNAMPISSIEEYKMYILATPFNLS